MASSPTRLLFVCLGNICRSPAAEGVMRATVEAQGLGEHFVIQSAGTAGYHIGNPPDSRMLRAASKRGIALRSRARQFCPDDFKNFDLILTMDEDNRRDVLALAPDDLAAQRVRSFATYCADPKVTHIPDPYYGGPEGFEHVLDLLQTGCRHLLAELRPH